MYECGKLGIETPRRLTDLAPVSGVKVRGGYVSHALGRLRTVPQDIATNADLAF